MTNIAASQFGLFVGVVWVLSWALVIARVGNTSRQLDISEK